MSPKELEIAIQIFHMNQLTAFPLSDEQIDDWTRSIVELRPDVTPQQLKSAIDDMKQGYADYDNRLGIQNIFKALDAGKINIPMTN